MPGPVPKRSEERRRRNKTTDSGVSNEVTTVIADPEALEDVSLVDAPTPNPAWGWLAMMQYDAARLSATRDFYEPTDWAQLFLACEALDQADKEQAVVIQSGPSAGEVVMVRQAISPAMLAAVNRLFGDLMFTEGQRRRARIEIERRSASTIVKQPVTGDEIAAQRSKRLGA